MAIVNGSLTIRGTSTLTAKSNAIWKISATLKGTSNLIAKGNAILTSSMVIKGSSNMSIFWLTMSSRSTVTIGTPIIQRLGNVVISSSSNLTAYLVKAAKAFLRVASIEGQIITSTSLEGGGSEYMKTNQDFELASGDYFETNVTVYDKDNQPKDISGYTFQWTMGGVVKTVTDGIVIVDAPNGLIQIVLQSEDTEKSYGTYPHKLIMTDVQGHSTTVSKGNVKIL